MKGVVLLEIQRAFFVHLNAQDPSFFLVDPNAAVPDMRAKIAKRAEDFVQWLPAKFFGTKWEWVSLDVGPGRDTLEATLRNLIDANGQFRWQRSSLVTGKAP